MTPLHAPDFSPLFKADAVNIAVSALKSGEIACLGRMGNDVRSTSA